MSGSIACHPSIFLFSSLRLFSREKKGILYAQMVFAVVLAQLKELSKELCKVVGLLLVIATAPLGSRFAIW
jgi:hypothetical protein